MSMLGSRFVYLISERLTSLQLHETINVEIEIIYISLIGTRYKLSNKNKYNYLYFN